MHGAQPPGPRMWAVVVVFSDDAAEYDNEARVYFYRTKREALWHITADDDDVFIVRVDRAEKAKGARLATHPSRRRTKLDVARGPDGSKAADENRATPARREREHTPKK